MNVRGLSCEWDRFDAYLFDIDGTLLRCNDAVHYFAFCRALQNISGKPLTLDGVTAHGNTDLGIMRDALTLGGVSESAWRTQLADIKESLCRYVEQRSDQVCVTVMPQVYELLQHLRSRGAKLGVATGNLERIGRIKLSRAGLLDYFDFAGWSDEFEFRSDVIRAALQEVRKMAGDAAAICVVGDTPSDIDAAKKNNVPVIAVATGIYSVEELELARPDICIHSFADLLCPV